MKSVLFYLCSTLLCISLFSCNDDDSPTVAPSPFTGTWELTIISLEFATDINGDGTSSTNILDEVSCIESSLEIMADSTWRAIGNTYRTSESGIIDDCWPDSNITGPWTVTDQGNIMINGAEFRLSNDLLVNTQEPNRFGVSGSVYQKQQ